MSTVLTSIVLFRQQKVVFLAFEKLNVLVKCVKLKHCRIKKEKIFFGNLSDLLGSSVVVVRCHRFSEFTKIE